MATSIPEKLKIKPGDTLLTLDAPPEFKKALRKLPAKVVLVTNGKDYQQIHWFVLTKAQLEKDTPKVLKLLREGVIVWVYYPKGSSGIQTDLTRDKGWECLLSKENKLSWISLISFNETWSVFGFRTKTAADKKKAAQPKEREIFKWINAQTKTIKLPDDFATVLEKNEKAAGFFQSLSFTNRKEYLEWIVTAKRPETRAERITRSIDRLGKGWKNPRNI